MKKMAFGVILAGVLGGCGSGGGAPPNANVSPLAKYEGTWVQACNNIGGAGTASLQVRLTNTLQSNGDLSYVGATYYYTGATCSGGTIAEITQPASTLHFDSTATVSGSVIEKTTSNTLANNVTATGSAVTLGTNLSGAPRYLVSYAGGTTSYDQAVVAQTGIKTALKAIGTTQLEGGEAPSDAAGYPITFPGTYIYTKLAAPVAVTALNPLAKYVGSWTNVCEASFAPSTSRNNLITQTLLPNGDLSVANIYRYFNGLACAGATVAEIVFPVATASFNSTVTVGASTVDRVFYSEPAGSITASGSIVTQTATQHVITHTGGIATEPLTQSAFSAKAAFKTVGTTQFSSAKNPADSAGYPATFASTPTYTKQ